MLRWYVSRTLTLYLPLALFALITLLPFYWMLITSLKRDQELYSFDDPLWVKQPTLMSYAKLLSTTPFVHWFKSSAIVALTSATIALLIGALAGFSIARLRFPGRYHLSQTVLLTYLVPQTLLFIPMYDIFYRLRWLDTYLSLIMSSLTFVVPFATWLLIGYFRSIPKEIEECAQIDGATKLQTLWRIVLPLSAPGLVSAGLFAFTQAWNMFIYPLVFISSPEKKTIPVGISALQMGDVFLWGQLMAAGVLASVPLVVFYTFFQRYMVEGLTAGAVKG